MFVKADTSLGSCLAPFAGVISKLFNKYGDNEKEMPFNAAGHVTSGCGSRNAMYQAMYQYSRP